MMYQEGPMFAGFEGVPELDVDGVARAGEPLAMGKAAASEAALIEAVSTVYDTEIPINIYDLGLIYEVEGGPDGSVKVAMTVGTSKICCLVDESCRVSPFRRH